MEAIMSPAGGAASDERGLQGTVAGIATRPARRAPMIEHGAIAITRAAGLAGDHKGRPGPRQVTLLFAEDWAAAVAALDQNAGWTIRRANLFLRGLINPRNAGARLRIGTALIETTGQTFPCERMEEALPGLRKTLAADWRGGCLGVVLEDGFVNLGDRAAFEGPLPAPRRPIRLPG